MLFTRQMRWQGPDRRRALIAIRRGRTRADKLGFTLQLFERQFQLLDLQGQLLGGLAEGHAAQLGKLDAQRRNEAVARRQCRFQLGDPSVLVEEGRSSVRHGEPLA